MKVKEKKKRIQFEFLQERFNQKSGLKEFLAIVKSKDRRGYPGSLIVKIGSAPVVSKKSKSRQ